MTAAAKPARTPADAFRAAIPVITANGRRWVEGRLSRADGAPSRDDVKQRLETLAAYLEELITEADLGHLDWHELYRTAVARAEQLGLMGRVARAQLELLGIGSLRDRLCGWVRGAASMHTQLTAPQPQSITIENEDAP